MDGDAREEQSGTDGRDGSGLLEEHGLDRVLIDCWRNAENCQVARWRDGVRSDVIDCTTTGARDFSAGPDRTFVFDTSPESLSDGLDDALLVSRAQAIHDWFTLSRPELANEPNLMVVSVGAERALLARMTRGVVASQAFVPELSLRALSGVYARSEEAMRHYLRAFPAAETTLWRNFRNALIGRYSDEGPLAFFDAPDLGCCVGNVGRLVEEFDPDRVCGTLLLSDWAGVEPLRRLFSRFTVLPGTAGPFDCAYDGFFSKTAGDLAPFIAMARRVREWRDSAVGAARPALVELYRAVRQCAAGHNRPTAYLPVMAILDRHRDEMDGLRREILALSGLSPSRPDRLPLSVGLAELEDYRLVETRLPDNVEVAVRLGGRLEITAIESEGYTDAGSGERLKKPEVVVRLEEPEMWRQAKAVLSVFPDVADEPRRFLHDVLAGRVEPGHGDPAGLLALLDFLRGKRDVLLSRPHPSRRDQDRAREIEGLRGFWLMLFDLRDISAPTIELPPGGGEPGREHAQATPLAVAMDGLLGGDMEFFVRNRLDPSAPPKRLQRTPEAYEGRLFATEVLRVGYRNVSTGKAVRTAQIVVVTELDRLIQAARPAVEKAALDPQASLSSITPTGVKELVLDEMEKRLFRFDLLDKDGVEAEEVRWRVLRFLDILATARVGVRDDWMAFLGLERYREQSAPGGRDGVRSRRTGRVWARPV